MFHPLLQPFLRLVSTRPELLGEHAEAYAELIAAETAGASANLKRRVVLMALATCGIGVGTVLVGVALMLWAVMPPGPAPAAWALIAVPLPPFLLAFACLWVARNLGKHTAFSDLRRQLAADVALFSQAKSP